MVFELFLWWYGAGWGRAAGGMRLWNNNVLHAFSMPVLLKTLFAPWRKITTTKGRSLDAKVRASVDNLVSRTVGFTTRLLVLIAAALLLILCTIAGVVVAVIWPFLPLLVIVCLYKGFAG